MATDLTMQRRFFAEEVQAICNVRAASLVEALASMPREKFLHRSWSTCNIVVHGLRLPRTMLHTWGQNLSQHLHVHCLVTGGALTAGGSRGIVRPRGSFATLAAGTTCVRDHEGTPLRELHRP